MVQTSTQRSVAPIVVAQALVQRPRVHIEETALRMALDTALQGLTSQEAFDDRLVPNPAFGNDPFPFHQICA